MAEQKKIVPELKINGKTMRPGNPKAKIWREVMKFADEKKEFTDGELMDKYAKVIALAFGGAVTAEDIMEQVELEEIVPTYRKIYAWVIDVATKKLEQIPNGETPEGK
jgi:hypothetical protein